MAYASSASTLTEIIQLMEQSGYGAQMIVADGGRITCRACGSTQRPARYEVHDQRRTEGASDPADMALVVAMRCPECGASGTLTAKYGPAATPDEAEVLRQLDGDELPRPDAD